MDSMENTGSLDSLFTNSGERNRSSFPMQVPQGDDGLSLAHSTGSGTQSNPSLFSPRSVGTPKKMKVFNVSMDDDDDDDEEDEDDFYDESERISPIHNVNGFRANTLWVNEE